jgi:hypothetical protein
MANQMINLDALTARATLQKTYTAFSMARLVKSKSMAQSAISVSARSRYAHVDSRNLASVIHLSLPTMNGDLNDAGLRHQLSTR